MAAAVTATKQELDSSRVRLDIEVGSQAVEQEVERAAETLGGDMKIPGFRQGRVPPQVVIQRVGREAVLDEAVRNGLPGWYEQAVHEAGVVTVGQPDVKLGALPDRGDSLSFSVEVGVRPTAKLGPYKDLEVPRRGPEVPDADIDAELDRLRESVASLETVERPAQKGDFVVLDFLGKIDDEPFEGGEARGHLLELGGGRFIEGFEEQLEGAAPGEEREVRVSFPGDYRAEHLAGKEAVFETTVKEIKEKRRPELDDDFATEAGGFDTLDELREDIRARLAEAQAQAIEGEFREAVVDAVVERATIEVNHELLHAKSHEMWNHTARRLQAQGIDPNQYLQMTGKTEEELVHEAEPEAERALRRESVLAAVVEAEGIEVSDEEIFASLAEAAATEPGAKPPSERKLRKAYDRMKADGRDELLREDIAMRKAVDLLVEHATPVDQGTAEARDKLWTPDKEGAEKAGELWTPEGSGSS